ncbi:E3 ubiquitin-protein ligase PUB23-like [Tasmannia lanceolata]|uniref:E3 ubiquitin-protein ligase PUB23-like n=1 Tax=Tasmannia lanceolata TaxID=3420 RepID=UPI004064BE85
MGEIDVPHYFLCPISLEIMKDPVTLCTGITYDRSSIERWIFSSKKKTCPVTKQELPDSDLTPNHAVRRLIQGWCIANASNGVERIPTPKPPIEKAQIIKLLEESRLPNLQMKSLQKLKLIVSESERNKRCAESAGAGDFLASIIKKNYVSTEEKINNGFDYTIASDEALSILYHLQMSEEGFHSLIAKNGEFVQTLTRVLQQGHYQSRSYAILLLKSIVKVFEPVHLIGLRCGTFREIMNVLRDPISNQATKAALQILIEICPWGRNRVKAADAGAVPLLIELILETTEKRVCEMVLVLLDQLCGCAEGRAEFLGHSAGIAIVAKKIIRVSHLASEKAVRILYSIAKFSATSSVLHEMLQVGAASKLCFLLQVECSMKIKEKAKEILMLHSRAWKNSPCIPLHLVSTYPSL